MKILAIDTATEACSAALYIDGVITEEYQLAPRDHTKLILKMVESLLEQAELKLTDLDALAFGRGPGSFTGVRISTGVIQGLAFASDLPVLPVSTLAALAQLAYDNHGYKAVLSGIDARMGEIYWGNYQLGENALMALTGDEKVSPAQNIKLPVDVSHKCCGAGSAWKSYSRELNETLGDQINDTYADYLPRASSITKLAVEAFNQGLAVKAAEALPVYLRNDVARKKADQ
ncbi:MAG: tRNA (adenosine(37)-N6)-threonylcarbamoyltransferase complex dimerization subunit type 1 TsaB [endosymbiont of Galathealinum brachiosum]|uniref:tRNA threonylcarbamoyladenosine biosynthesis protein TsaB n=1 Tax=endosymbiont of Galathealinum brachiosum TaxID=2200906 RepID=A0A370DHB2_9GAMM|nr:MAG: tRNA (adenosine(37)-N6)-threonylcarbamoyltransferase complex dimerization subunit type 1 TsaB [endosymbiont of Galathealinum brachiosum]